MQNQLNDKNTIWSAAAIRRSSSRLTMPRKKLVMKATASSPTPVGENMSLLTVKRSTKRKNILRAFIFATTAFYSAFILPSWTNTENRWKTRPHLSNPYLQAKRASAVIAATTARTKTGIAATAKPIPWAVLPMKNATGWFSFSQIIRWIVSRSI